MREETSRFTPQNPQWQVDLPERDAPDNDRPAIFDDLNHIDETYLEISRASGAMRGAMTVLSIPAFVFPVLIISALSSDITSLTTEFDWFSVVMPILFFGLIAGGILALRLDLAPPRDEPIRFNRKRGKVYVTIFKHTWNPFAKWGAVAKEFDWNTIQAEVTKFAGFNGKTYMVRYALVLVSVKPGTNEVVDRFILKSNIMTTMELHATWAYCRLYMARGPEAVPEFPARIQEISFRRSFFHYLYFLDPTEEGRQARKEMPWYEFVLAAILIPGYPIFALMGLGHYIAMRVAPAAIWPPEMDAESKSSPLANEIEQRKLIV